MLLCTVFMWRCAYCGMHSTVAETCRSNLNNNKLINEKLICAFRWSVLPSISIEYFICKPLRRADVDGILGNAPVVFTFFLGGWLLTLSEENER